MTRVEIRLERPPLHVADCSSGEEQVRRDANEHARNDRLHVMSGPQEGRVIELDFSGRAAIGRSSECEITLKDLSISRRHAEIHKTPSGRWRIRDLGSRNGISVDGRTGPGWLVIDRGSEIHVGDVRLHFESGADPHPDITEPETDPDPATPMSRVARTRSERVRSSARADDPPSLPDLEPAKLDVAPPPWREGIKTTGASEEDEENHPPYLLGAGIGLGLALAMALLIIVVGNLGSEDADHGVEPSTTAETREASTRALMEVGREAVSGARWSEAENAYLKVLEEDPRNSKAKGLLELVRREKRAKAEVEEAREAFDQGEMEEALLLAESVRADSRYRDGADELIDLIESGETERSTSSSPLSKMSPPPSEEPTTKKASASTAKRPPRVASKRPSTPRRPKKTTTSRPSGTDPILNDAKELFSKGRVSGARAAAEAAADAGVSGAGELFSKLESFHRASGAGESAQRNGQIPLALAHFTDALATARELSPPSGGRPGQEASSRLADLHYQSARQSLDRDDLGAARAHLERALRFEPGHSDARSLLENL